MATLQIRKKSAKVWKHIPSDANEFILSKLYAKTDANSFKIVEDSGSNRREYNYTDISVFDDTDAGVEETFASAELLMLRLEALSYVGFNRDGDVPAFDPSTHDLTEFLNADVNPFIRESELPTPLGFTPENVANKATTMTGNTTSNTLYLTAKAVYDWGVGKFQDALVSGTNIKTINGTTVLGSGNLVVGGSSTKEIRMHIGALSLDSSSTWQSWGRTISMLTANINSPLGTGATPTSFIGNTTYLYVKGCDLVNSITLSVTQDDFARTYEIYIKSCDYASITDVNPQVLVQQQFLTVGGGKSQTNLTVNSHLLSSDSIIYVAVRGINGNNSIQGFQLLFELNKI